MKRSTRLQRPGLLGGSTANTLLDADGPQPSLNLDLASGILDPRIDFQRTTVGTYYRGQFNQNLFTQSQDLTNAAYVAIGATVANITDTAPDGSTTVTRMTESATNDRHLIGRSAYVPLAANLTYTLSVFVKKVSRRYIQLIGLSGASNSFSAIFDLDNGVITDTRAQGGNYISGSITPVGNGWYRCSITGNTTIAQTTLSVVHSNVATFALATLAFGSPSYLGDGTSQTLVWGYQLTEGTLLTPYIPTTTAAITQGQIASSQPWNLLLRSQEFNLSPWGAVAAGVGLLPVITANDTLAPDGTMTADKVVFDAVASATANRSILQQIGISLVSGSPYTQSVWIKGAVGGEQVLMRATDGINYNLMTATTDWQRIQFTSIAGATSGMSVEVRPGISGCVNTNATVWLWGAQLNEGPAALDYRSTTSSALWLPRFENDPVTGEARGLLIEGGATNLCLQSADLTTTWVPGTKVTVTANAITAPDGTLTADSVIDTASTNSHEIYQTIGAQSTTATYTVSAFVKKGSRQYVTIGQIRSPTEFYAAQFDLDNPTASPVTGASGAGFSVSNATITNVGNGWYRLTVSGIGGIATHYPTFVSSASAWAGGTANPYPNYAGSTANFTYVWGFQYEAQAFASSYIPTVAASVARGADSAVMTGTNFSSWYNQSEGTLFTELRVNNLIAVRQGANINSPVGGSNLNFVATGTSASDVFVATRIAATVYGDFLATTSLGPHKLASAYTQSVQAGAANGTEFADTSTPAFVVTLDRMHIGDNPVATAPLNGNISRISYWPTRLPNATLQSLTT